MMMNLESLNDTLNEILNLTKSIDERLTKIEMNMPEPT